MSNLAAFSEVDVLKTQNKNLNADYFIFSKGSEDRSYNVFEKYLELIAPQKIIMLDSRMKNEELTSDEINKYNRIDDLAMSKETGEIKCISLESAEIGRNLVGEGLSKDSIVAVDVSSMNFWEMSDLLYYLLKVVCVQRIDILYTEPDLYHYENDNISHYAHNDIKVSVNYPRSYFSTKTTDDEILVSMLGFQKSTNKLFKDIFEVSEYYSINGFPSFYPKAKDISQANNADYLSEIDPLKRFSAEAVNPFIVFNTLIDIKRMAQGAFMNICPLCSKPMAIGACLYALKFPETSRIVYPYAETVTTKADGIGKTYYYCIWQDFLQ